MPWTWTTTGRLRDALHVGPVSLTRHDDGSVSGDPLAVRVVRSTAREWEREGRSVGPVCGPYAETNDLSDPIFAAMVIADVFVFGADVTGNVWMRAAEPPGVVT